MKKSQVERSIEFLEPIRARYEVPRDYYNTNYTEYQDHGTVSVSNGGIVLQDPSWGAMPYYRMQLTSKNLPISFFSADTVLLEAELQFQAMPIYRQSYHTAKAAYGFSLIVSDTTAEGSRNGRAMMFCFLNTENGLAVYPNRQTDALPIAAVALGKKVGERFHIGVMIRNETAEILIDGRSICVFESVVAWRNLMYYNRVKGSFFSNISYGSQAISFVWQRNGDDIVSGESDFVVQADQIKVSILQADEKTEKKFEAIDISDQKPCVFARVCDHDPITGEGTYTSGEFRADRTFNSVIYDTGEVGAINRAELLSQNHASRVSRNFVALYHSTDNKTYIPVPFFSMLKHGSDILFYNFSVRARYLKIHFTYQNSASRELDVVNSLQQLMNADYDERPLLCGNGEFAYKTTVEIPNDGDRIVRDKVVCLEQSDLGIQSQNVESDMRDVRFRYGGWELPYLFRNGRFYVRIFEIAAKSTARLEVLYGNPLAESVSDGVGTFEIEYGNKTETQIPGGRWITSVEVMPDGSLITLGHYAGQMLPCIVRSTDGGRTWSDPTPVRFTDDTDYRAEVHQIHDSGGFIVDVEKNTVYFFCFHNTSEPKGRSIILLTSLDSGYSWHLRKLELPTGMFYCTYSNGIKLSSHDGVGSAVDYVFTLALKETDGNHPFGCSAIYSKDDGKTWHLSESRINHRKGNFSYGLEKGISEDTVLEKPDGTLVMYCRYQIEGVLHFAISRSYDHGITWEEEPDRSNVYATNTQPILFGSAFTPMLLWGGNCAMGTMSYCRFPMNLAYSCDCGESFVGIQDVSFQLRMANREAVRRLTAHEITNPDVAVFERCGLKYAYIISMQDRVLIEDLDRYLCQTRGAFDSFDCGYAESEGWVTVSGERPIIRRREDTYSMVLGSETKLSRSVPYLRKGTVFFDLHLERILGGMYIELQSAYHRDPCQAAPITLRVDCQGYVFYNASGEWIDTGLILQHGENALSVSFDAADKTACLNVNGIEKEIAFLADVGDYVCFAYLLSGHNSEISLDCFAVWDQDET